MTTNEKVQYTIQIDHLMFLMYMTLTIKRSNADDKMLIINCRNWKIIFFTQAFTSLL